MLLYCYRRQAVMQICKWNKHNEASRYPKIQLLGGNCNQPAITPACDAAVSDYFS